MLDRCAGAHRESRKPSEAVYDSFADDGLLYSSSPTAAERIAIYDRAVGVKLSASPTVELVEQAELIPAVQSPGYRSGRRDSRSFASYFQRFGRVCSSILKAWQRFERQFERSGLAQHLSAVTKKTYLSRQFPADDSTL